MRLIDADAVIDRYYADWEYHCIRLDQNEREWLRQCIDDAPTIEAEPVKHGRWEKCENDGFEWHQCSICQNRPLNDHNERPALSDYCPNCGAKMDLEG